jgi:hypothetical protein
MRYGEGGEVGSSSRIIRLPRMYVRVYNVDTLSITRLIRVHRSILYQTGVLGIDTPGTRTMIGVLV